MSNKFIVSIDEGTSSARAFVFDEEVNVKSFAQFEIGLSYPRPGYVEQDPEEIWNVQLKALKEATSKIDINKILGIGITNQRETTILWDDRTGKPVYNAIVWQDRRTADLSDQFKKTYLKLIREKTGLIPDPYFSATKIKWLLDNNPKIKEKAMKGEIKFGTVDTFLIWKLTDGTVHVTDYSNASRTMLFNINKLEWDIELLELFNIPEEILPEVRPSSEIYGYTNVLGKEVPISSDIGDQQAALFGQVCFNKGETKATYGTGTFILMNTGNERKDVEGLLTTIAWNIGGSTSYALEGSVFTTGAALQWAKDNLGIAKNYEEMEKLASSVNNNELVYFVPALTGLGAPYWDPHARGIIIGITRNTTGAHILRALFESIAFQTKDIIDLMQSIVGKKVEELKVDGGSTKSNFLLQLLADILGIKILRPKNTETTSMGAAFLAGLTVDLWKLNDIKALWFVDTYFLPKIESEKREFLYNKWKEAVKRSMSWI